MSNVFPSVLEAKVTARNRVNHELRTQAPSIFFAFAPFVGQKIKKVDGSFTAAFHSVASKFVGPGCYWSRSDYSLSLVFRADATDARGHNQSQQAMLYIGNLDGQTLANLDYQNTFNPASYPTDYEAEDILEARKRVNEARAALSKAEGELSGFGESDY